jgi:hypothetical protein
MSKDIGTYTITPSSSQTTSDSFIRVPFSRIRGLISNAHNIVAMLMSKPWFAKCMPTQILDASESESDNQSLKMLTACRNHTKHGPYCAYRYVLLPLGSFHREIYLVDIYQDPDICYCPCSTPQIVKCCHIDQ